MALEVLREALELSRVERVDSKGVQLALRVLRRHVDDVWLKQFWTSAGMVKDSPRFQHINASLNGIERNLAGRRKG